MRFSVYGHELDYETHGEGRALVLLHGLAADRRVLVEACEPVLSQLPGWRRIYVDLPGHGASLGNLEWAGADELVAALAAFVREVAPQGACVLGYAYGAYLAQGLVRELPNLGGLFLVCPTIEPEYARRVLPPRRVAVDEGELSFSDDPRERQAFDEVAVVRSAAVLEAFQRAVHPGNIGANPAFVAAVRARYAMARPYGAALQAFAEPVTIACGRDDHWVGFEDALKLARTLINVHFAVLPGCGHLLPLESPLRFHTLLMDWIYRV